MTELGKAGKHMGVIHPRDLRKTDPVPLRPTPTAKPHTKADKLFGIAYEFRTYKRSNGSYRSVWKARSQWFKTEAHRDQALASMVRNPCSWIRHLAPTLRR